MNKPVYVGMKAAFFHPQTMGVMYTGTVVKILENGFIRVKFNIDDKVWTTHKDNN